MIFQDSDAAKWLEAVASALTRFPDAQLEKEADELIELIAQAQDKDGYLDTRFTLKDRDKRWTNLCEGHELYCMGHMMEAAAAYFEATGKRTLLDVMIRNAEYLYQRFVVEGQPGYPGHPEVELALLKLYRVTGNEHCLKLAEHFIDVRGVNSHFYQEEAKKRDWTEWHMNVEDTQYMQCDKPVRELSDATGHSVRAMYLYTAMADLASQTEDPALKAACRRLWESTTHRRMLRHRRHRVHLSGRGLHRGLRSAQRHCLYGDLRRNRPDVLCVPDAGNGRGRGIRRRDGTGLLQRGAGGNATGR